MSKVQGWKQHFQPWLEDKRNASFPDPAHFTSEADFTYAAKVASVFKKVVTEILQEVENQCAAAEAYDKKVEEPDNSNKFSIGA